MNKNLLYIAIAVIVLGAGMYVLFGNPKQSTAPLIPPSPVASTTFDPLNATYIIDGQSIALINGKAKTPDTPGSAITMNTNVFGKPATGDLNADGKTDAAVIITQNDGGTGTFYYVAAAINVPGGTEGTNAILLGDRIAPQNISIKNGQVVVNYADRKPSEPFSTRPSIGVTKYLSYIGSTLKEATPVAGPGENCGGNMTTAPVCESGYHCAPRPGSHLPLGDVGGTCIAN